VAAILAVKDVADCEEPDVITLVLITGVPLIVGLLIAGLVNVLFVNVSVVERPTNVVFAVGKPNVYVPVVFGDDRITVPAPEALLCTCIELMYYP
jgi:hypothetical protein